jgi:chemotaxis protein methyltransferase CheR
MTVKIAEKDFEALRDFIYSICGIYFQSSKKYFVESRVVNRMAEAGTATAVEYIALLRNSLQGKEELKRLLNDITTNETFFFRNVSQLTALEQQFLPELIENKAKIGFRKLRIWSAGSSSGEEAYTLAMILLEKRQSVLKDWVIEIVGTDINEEVLAQAREGVYTPYAVRNTPEPYRKKYFTADTKGRFILSPVVKKMVTFSSLNLYDDSKMLFMKSFDFIFCANVLIYFDSTSKSKVVQHFYNNLQPYGYFFVGQAESLHGVNDKFKAIHFPGGFVYKK